MASQRIWTIKAILEWCTDYLERAGCENARSSAQWLLSEATGLSRLELYTNFDKPLTRVERDTMREWVRRRAAGEPLQLICGTAPFRYLTVKVAPGVLIPRPETEVLVSECFSALALPKSVSHAMDAEGGEKVCDGALRSLEVLDLCTGSGCIACAIASEYPAAHVVATDVAPAALALAQENVRLAGLGKRVEVRASDLFDALLPEDAGRFDLVISNPPYVPSAVCDGLSQEVRAWDPRLALDGGTDGLDLFRRLLPDALIALKPGGLLGVELFEGHLDLAARLTEAAGFAQVRIRDDLTGRPRVLLAVKRCEAPASAASFC